jgi:tRNA pseudouridine32 synthase/23S rRNA pseudouridine746 synthase
MHRLDRDTAGVILFSVEEKTRGAYHQMFPEGRVDKEYDAIAYLHGEMGGATWEVSNRLSAATP